MIGSNNQQSSQSNSNGLQQTWIALDDNPISQQYECLKPKINHASTGPCLSWLIYAATKKRTSDLAQLRNLNQTQLTNDQSAYGASGLSDALSVAYTSLKQRNSFSGLSAALSGSGPSAAATDTTNKSINRTNNNYNNNNNNNNNNSNNYNNLTDQDNSTATSHNNNQAIDQQANVLINSCHDTNINVFHNDFTQFPPIYGRCGLAQVPVQQRFYNQLLQQHINELSLGNKLSDRVSIFFYDKKAPQLFENNLANATQCSMQMSNSTVVRAQQSYLQLGDAIKYKKKDLALAQDLLRLGVKHLERNRQMKMLLLLQTIEESSNTIAFVTEAILCSLQNCIDLNNNLGFPLVYMGQELCLGTTNSHNNAINKATIDNSASKINQDHLEQQIGYYQLTQFEVKYGLLQITEALLYLHYSSKIIHRNINAKSILINIRGTWKLTGLEFALKSNAEQGLDPMLSRPCPPYNNKISHCVQPELDYFAPEIQLSESCSPQSDMFSLGILITQIFNYKSATSEPLDDFDQYQRKTNTQLYRNKPLIDCDKNSNNYLKQIEQLNFNIVKFSARLPRLLEEPLKSLLDVDPKKRLNSEGFSMINYFTNDGIHALQYLDMINTKDSAYKSNFYHNLTGVLDQVPKKMWYQHILPSILDEIQRNELVATIIEPILYILNHSNTDEFELILLPFIKLLFYVPKSVRATVSLLDNFHIIINKIRQSYPYENQSKLHQQQLSQMSQLMLTLLDSGTIQIQSSSLDALMHIVDFIDHDSIGTRVISKIRQISEANINDLNIQLKVLRCLECFLIRLNKTDILNNVLPVLVNTRIDDHSILIPLIGIYRKIMDNDEQRSALTCNLLASHIMPTLLPALVCPDVTMNEFSSSIELLQDMLDNIKNIQRQRIKSGINTTRKEDQAYGENWLTCGADSRQTHVGSNLRQSSYNSALPSMQQTTSAHQSLSRSVTPNQTTKLNYQTIEDDTKQTNTANTRSFKISKPLNVQGLPSTMITSASSLENSTNDSNQTDNYNNIMNSIDQYFNVANDDNDNKDIDSHNQELKPNIDSQQQSTLSTTQSSSIKTAQSTQVSPVHAFRMKEKEQQQQRPPTLRLEKRRTSISMDDVIRRMSMNASSSCLLGSGGTSDSKNSSSNCGFLKVNNQVPGRRHSDNTILPPKILIAPSSPDHSIASRLGSKLKLNLSNQKLSSSSNKGSKCNLAAAAVNYTRRHSSANDNQPSISPSLFLNSSTFKTKSSSNLGFDFLLTNRSMKRRYSTASMLGHQTQRKAENLIESIGSAGMKGMQQIFGK